MPLKQDRPFLVLACRHRKMQADMDDTKLTWMKLTHL